MKHKTISNERIKRDVHRLFITNIIAQLHITDLFSVTLARPAAESIFTNSCYQYKRVQANPQNRRSQCLQRHLIKYVKMNFIWCIGADAKSWHIRKISLYVILLFVIQCGKIIFVSLKPLKCMLLLFFLLNMLSKIYMTFDLPCRF